MGIVRWSRSIQGPTVSVKETMRSIWDVAKPIQVIYTCRPMIHSYPRPINLVHTSTHKRALRTQQKDNDIRRLLRRALSPESRGVIKRCVLGPAHKIPILLHEGRVHGAGGDRVDANFAVAVFQGRGLGEADDAVFAGIISGVLCEA